RHQCLTRAAGHPLPAFRIPRPGRRVGDWLSRLLSAAEDQESCAWETTLVGAAMAAMLSPEIKAIAAMAAPTGTGVRTADLVVQLLNASGAPAGCARPARRGCVITSRR